MAIEECLGWVENINIDEKTADVRIRDLDGRYVSLKYDGEELYKYGAFFKGAKIKYIIEDNKTKKIEVLNPQDRPAEKIYKVPPIVATAERIRKRLAQKKDNGKR